MLSECDAYRARFRRAGGAGARARRHALPDGQALEAAAAGGAPRGHVQAEDGGGAGAGREARGGHREAVLERGETPAQVAYKYGRSLHHLMRLNRKRADMLLLLLPGDDHKGMPDGAVLLLRSAVNSASIASVPMTWLRSYSRPLQGARSPLTTL